MTGAMRRRVLEGSGDLVSTDPDAGLLSTLLKAFVEEAEQPVDVRLVVVQVGGDTDRVTADAHEHPMLSQ